MKIKSIKLFLPLFLISLMYQSNSIAAEVTTTDTYATMLTNFFSGCTSRISTLILANKIASAAVPATLAAAIGIRMAWSHYCYKTDVNARLDQYNARLGTLENKQVETHNTVLRVEATGLETQRQVKEIRENDIRRLQEFIATRADAVTSQMALQAQAHTEALTRVEVKIDNGMSELKAGQAQILTRLNSGYFSQGLQGPLGKRHYSVSSFSEPIRTAENID